MISAGTSIRFRHRVIGEIHVTVGFRPQADPPRDRLGQRVFEIEFAVEIALDLGAADPNLQVVPLARGSRRVSHPSHRGTLALFELPEHEIVLEAVGADREVIAVWFQIEQDARALVDTTGQPFEANCDFSVREVVDVGCDHIRIVCIGLHAIEELCVTFAIKCTRLIGDACRGLAFLPLAAIDDKDLLSVIVLDPPEADDRYERLRLGAGGFTREIDCCRLGGKTGQR